MKRMIGLYGGTFDPIHVGHLNLALSVMEARQLEEVWFCPVWLSPHKLDRTPPVPAEHRLEMVRLALEDVPHCKVIDHEVKLGKPSYTLDTIDTLQKQYPDKNFCLIVGDDAIPGFFRWHRPEEIVKKVPVLIGSRKPELLKWDQLVADPMIAEKLKRGITPTPIIDVSSTLLRKWLAEGKYCAHLIPSKVMDYIQGNKLYYLDTVN